MLVINRLVMIGLLSVGIFAATAAHAGNQLFTAEWSVGGFGNECDGKGNPPYCTVTTGDYAIYQNWAMPAGYLCNPGQPRCPFSETPVNGTPNAKDFAFNALGGHPTTAIFCEPYTLFTSGYKGGASGRPAKGNTVFDPAKARKPIPPLYRNPFFFTSAGQPKVTACTGTTTGVFTSTQTRFGADKGYVQRGKPVAGTWDAVTNTAGSFSFRAAALKANNGVRQKTIGEFTNIYPYIYSYTYADFANDAGLFGPGQGIGTFTYKYKQGANTVARINVTPGASRFGGTMRLLGKMTTKVCYFRNGGCSLGSNNWLYEVVGTSGAPRATPSGPVTAPYITTTTAYYYQTAGNQTSVINVVGLRFPWTTGMVTVTARKRGEFKTVHYATGYDNRNPVTGKGTIQLVTPVMTHWLQTAANIDTAGIGLLKITFVPEPQTWLLLFAGASLLGVGYRMRGR